MFEQRASGSWLGAHFFRSRQGRPLAEAELVKFKCAPLLTYILLSIYQIPLIYLDDHNLEWALFVK